MDSDSPSTRPAQYVELDGIMWPTMVTHESLKAIKDFEVWAGDVWVATYPKSGTHWVAEICGLIKHNGDVVDDAPHSPVEFVTLSNHHQEDHAYSLVSEWKPPRVIATHVPVKYLPRQLLEGGKGKVISVIRNPKDTVVSEFYFLKGFKPGAPETFSQCLVENGTSENAPYTTWFGHVLGYWAQRHHRQFLILKFEDMKQDTRSAVIKIAEFMGRPLSDELVNKIVDLVHVKTMSGRFTSSAGDTNPKAKLFVRKGIVGDWKTHFTVAENEAFDALYRRKMAGSGLQLQFE